MEVDQNFEKLELASDSLSSNVLMNEEEKDPNNYVNMNII